jgi:uncharacterized protein YjdB
MRFGWLVGAAFGLILLFGTLPAAEGTVGTKIYLPLVGKDATFTPTATPTRTATAVPTSTHTPTPRATATPLGIQVRYRAYVSGVGWQEYRSQGEIAGTTGQSRAIEAIQLDLLNAPANANVRYRVHVAFQGWLDWSDRGGIAGKPGEGLQIEAMQIGLQGVPEGTYISTEVHARDWGWLGHVRDFWETGTRYQSRRIEAFRAYVRTGSPEPAQVRAAYSLKLQDRDWTDWNRNGETGGTTGEQRRVEAMRVVLYNKPESMDVEYIVNLEGSSWGAWTRDAGVAGAPGQNRSIFAYEMRLISRYEGSHVNYQGHYQNKGWLGPIREGALGKPEDGLRLEAIRVHIDHDRP